jgi:hypothetical protein
LSEPLAVTLLIAKDAGALLTKDNNTTPAVVKYRYSGGPESLTDLFITQSADLVVILDEPNVTTNRSVDNQPHYNDYDVPVIIRAINRYSGGVLVSTAPLIIGKMITLFLDRLVANAHLMGYEISATRGAGDVKRRAGMNIHEENVTVKFRVMV